MSSQDDPFGPPPDATVIRPRPGGGRRGDRAIWREERAAPAEETSADAVPTDVRDARAVGLNPLLRAASPLLLLAGRLRGSPSVADVDGLRRDTLAEIRRFEEHARSLRVRPEVITAARYALCAALDEAVLSTPWGVESNWPLQTLLLELHDEARGGEKFFEVLDGISEDPSRHIDLIELYYVCLSFGFAGKYETLERGRDKLAAIRRRVAGRIRDQRDAPPPELAVRWRGLEDRRNPIERDRLWWVVAAAAGVVLVLAYAAYIWNLGQFSAPVYAQLETIGYDAFTQVRSPAPREPAVGPTLRELLASEEAGGELSIAEQGPLTTLTLSAPDLFPSGRSTINPEYEDLLRRVGEAIAVVGGDVLVDGHTDDVPISTPRFPNNEVLSRARAEGVADILRRVVDGAIRIDARGLGATEPRFTPEALPENRARNRRVEIVHARES